MLGFSDNKAGLSGLDKERIDRIIAENTSSQYDRHAQKKRQRIDEQIAENGEKLSRITPKEMAASETEIKLLVSEIEGNERRLDRVKVHIDMDAYFAAVEMRDCPRLRTVPMAVGTDAMLSTSNYLARKFGVRSAMPGFIARKLCPQLVLVSGHYHKYRRESGVIRQVFERFDPYVRMGSLDEAYLDLTSHLAQRTAPVCCPRVRYRSGANFCECLLPLFPSTADIDVNQVEMADVGTSADTLQRHENELQQDINFKEEDRGPCDKCGKVRVAYIDEIEFGTDADAAVAQIRHEVEQATGLTCSAGIAANSLLAKVCTDIHKPNGQFRLAANRDEILAFMRELPIRKIPGIGAVTEAVLKASGVITCGELLEKLATLKLVCSNCHFQWLARVALGVSGSGAESGDGNEQQKSTSTERTFKPTSDLVQLRRILHSLCEDLCQSLANDGICGGRTATLKVKFASFDVVTRAQSANFLISNAELLFATADNLLRRELKARPENIRLLGVRLSALEFAADAAALSNLDVSPTATTNAGGGAANVVATTSGGLEQRTLAGFWRKPLGRKGNNNGECGGEGGGAKGGDNNCWPIVDLLDESDEEEVKIDDTSEMIVAGKATDKCVATRSKDRNAGTNNVVVIDDDDEEEKQISSAKRHHSSTSAKDRNNAQQIRTTTTLDERREKVTGWLSSVPFGEQQAADSDDVMEVAVVGNVDGGKKGCTSDDEFDVIYVRSERGGRRNEVNDHGSKENHAATSKAAANARAKMKNKRVGAALSSSKKSGDAPTIPANNSKKKRASSPPPKTTLDFYFCDNATTKKKSLKKQ